MLHSALRRYFSAGSKLACQFKPLSTPLSLSFGLCRGDNTVHNQQSVEIMLLCTLPLHILMCLGTVAKLWLDNRYLGTGVEWSQLVNYSLDTEAVVLVCLCCDVCEAYSASSAAPSASTTRLVSSLEICKASARCMSVMVQKDATRWSGDRTGDVTGHNLPSASKKRGSVFKQCFPWCKHAAKMKQNKKATTFLTGRADSFMLCMNEWHRLKPPRAVFLYSDL